MEKEKDFENAVKVINACCDYAKEKLANVGDDFINKKIAFWFTHRDTDYSLTMSRNSGLYLRGKKNLWRLLSLNVVVANRL